MRSVFIFVVQWKSMPTLRTAVKIGVSFILTVLLLVLLVPIGMRAVMGQYMYISFESVPQAQVVIIPGASVVKRRPSPILAERADVAIKLYNKGKVSKILVTGDDDELLHYDEVTPVRKYLIDAGIPAEDIFLDHAGVDTYSSMYRTVHVFNAKSAIVVTQDFHLPRALYIARHMGLDTYGVVANGQGEFVGGYLREIPASVKALWDLTFSRVPATVGDPVDLSGDGQATWGQ